MKKNVIALLLAIVLVTGSIGTAPVFAAEMTAEEAVSLEVSAENEEQEEASGETEVTEDSSVGMTDEMAPKEETIIAKEESPTEDVEEVAEVEESSDEQDEIVDAGETGGIAVPEEETLESVDVRDTSAVTTDFEKAVVIEEEIITAEENEAVFATSGVCGPNATWQLTGSGVNLTLTISGNGKMNDTIGKSTLWLQSKEKIKKVVINDGITSISSNAFFDCYNLSSVTIPEGVTSIGSNAFTRCYSLKDITIPNSVSSIGAEAFVGCRSLSSISIPNRVMVIEELTFSGCESLSNVLFGDNVTSIEVRAFQGCGLENIIIPEGVINIGSCAFQGNSSLRHVTILGSVDEIGDWAFADCDLISVKIGNGTKHIGEYAFVGGENNYASIIEIPGSVTWIGEHAFNPNAIITFFGTEDQWNTAIGYRLVYYASITFSSFSVDAEFTLPHRAYYYTGKPILGEVIVTYGEDVLVEGTDYELQYENNTDIGTATVYVNGIGNYSGTAQLQFRIRLGNPTKVTCTNLADCMKVEWEKVPGATQYKVYRDDKLIKTTSGLVIGDKDVRYEVGKKFTYKVVATNNITGDSDLCRTCTYYRLLPVGVKTLTSPSAGKLTVTYGKCDGCYGYVVRYGKKSDMSDSKTLAVKGANTLTKTISVEKSKTYYVQVRTYMLVNGVRYFSTYSRIQSIKVK